MEPFELVTELEHTRQVAELERIGLVVDIRVVVRIAEQVGLMAHNSFLEEQIRIALVAT